MKISLYPPLSIYELGQRDNQEDAISQSDGRLFVLCDGMGGHEHGEVASQTVCEAIGSWFQSRAIHPLSKAQIEDALAYAYAQLDQKDTGGLRKMGTTLTLLYVGDEGIMAAHMGDSRIYHIRPGKGILYQSRDHSLVFDLFQAGEITYEEMLHHPKKNIITRAMTPGEDNRSRPDIIHITDVQPNDYFYMCSDGMLENMQNQELVALLSSNEEDAKKRDQLIERTQFNQDNHTAWLIHIKDVVKEEGDETLPNEEPSARCNVVVSMPELANEEDDVVIVNEEEKSIFQRIKSLFNL